MTAADHATPPSPVSGRFAPSPSGPMHLGNARTALLAWLDVRARGGRMLLRVEDLDRDRCRPQWIDLMRRDLEWLGLDWDEEAQPQSLRDGAYDAALDRLREQGLVYPCFCSRRELAVASAPHGPADTPYPGTCRALSDGQRAERIAEGRRPAQRVALPDHTLSITDRLCGVVSQRLAADVGDIIVRRSDGLYAYQLAVVVDDAADGVSDVVRGDDLLGSTPRQVALQQMLGLPTPAYAHVPLVLGRDGERLAKRHGPVSLLELRERGVSPERLLGYLAALSGIGAGDPARPAELVPGFGLEHVTREPARVDAAAIAAL
jgi:glutamyl-tRNA synthetase